MGESHETRLVVEYTELTQRIDKLKDFINACYEDEAKKLALKTPIETLENQLRAMNFYKATLEARFDLQELLEFE